MAVYYLTIHIDPIKLIPGIWVFIPFNTSWKSIAHHVGGPEKARDSLANSRL